MTLSGLVMLGDIEMKVERSDIVNASIQQEAVRRRPITRWKLELDYVTMRQSTVETKPRQPQDSDALYYNNNDAVFEA